MHVEKLGIVGRNVGQLLAIPLGTPCPNLHLVEAEIVLLEEEGVGGPGVLEEDEPTELTEMKCLQPHF